MAEAALRPEGGLGAEHPARQGVVAALPKGRAVANPWTKKNPLMSMWLSAANTWAGAARGMMAAEMGRARKTAAKAATRTPAAGGKKRRKSK